MNTKSCSEPKIFKKSKVKKSNKSCCYCKYISEGSEFEFKKDAKPFFVKFNFKYESSNHIYVVICPGYQEECIVQNGTLFKEKACLSTAYKPSTISNDQSWKACNFIKKRPQHRCFHVNIVKFLRTPIFKNICEHQLLSELWTSCMKYQLTLFSHVSRGIKKEVK